MNYPALISWRDQLPHKCSWVMDNLTGAITFYELRQGRWRKTAMGLMPQLKAIRPNPALFHAAAEDVLNYAIKDALNGSPAQNT